MIGALRTPWGERSIASILEYGIEMAVPTGDAEIGQFKWIGWTELQLNAISFGLPNETPLMQISSLQIDLWRIEASEYRGRIQIEEPIVQISVNEEGVSNLDRMFPPSNSESDAATEWPDVPVDLHFYTIEVQRGVLKYLDQTIQYSTDLTLGWKDNQAYVDIHQLTLNTPEYGEIQTSVDVHGDHQVMQIQAELQHEQLSLVSTASIQDLFQSPTMGLRTDVWVAENAGALVGVTNTPLTAIELGLAAEGALNDLRVQLSSSVGLQAEGDLNLEGEIWNVTATMTELTPSDLLPDLEPTILSGGLNASGTGWSLDAMRNGSLNLHVDDAIVWGESIQEIEMSSRVELGRLEDVSLKIRHASGGIDASGEVDVLQSEVDLTVVTSVTDLSAWTPEWVALIEGRHMVQGTWQNPTEIEVQGDALIADVRNEDGIGVRKATVQTQGMWTGIKTQLQNQIVVEQMQAVGVEATELSANVMVELTDKGVDLRGHTTLDKAVVGDGTLELRTLSGQFQMVQDEELFFETQDMTVGQVTLIPAQYVVDGGALELRLDGDNLLAELHLLRNHKTFIETLAHADITDGIWQVDELNFSPTGTQPWSLKQGFSFHLTDSGVGDMALELESDAGLIQVRVDQQNQQPDIMVDIQDLDLDYVAAVTNLFVAPNTLPPDLSGQAFGTIHLLGEEGRFQSGDFLLLKDVNIPDIAYDLQLAVDLAGGLEDIKMQLNLESDAISILKAQATVPLDNGGLDCTRTLYTHVMLPEHQIQHLVGTIPILPDMDLVAMLETTVRGDACSPTVQLFTQGHTPVGNAGERVRWEMDLSVKDDRLTGSGQVTQAVQSWLSLDVNGNTNIAGLLQGEDTTGFDTLTLSMDIEDLYLQKLGQLLDVPGLGRGKIDGDTIMTVTPSAWTIDGQIVTPNVRLAKHRLTSDSGVRFDISSTGVDAEWQIDFEKKGAFTGTVDWSFDSDALLVSSTWDDVPALLLTVGVADVTNGYGRLGGSLLIDGTMADPNINMLAQLQGFGFDLPSMGLRYRDINVEAVMEDTFLTIPNMTGEASIIQNTLVSRWGQFAGSSSVTFDDAILATMELRLSEFPLIHTNSMQATVSGRLTGRQGVSNTDLDGELYVHQGLVRLERDFFEEGASLALPDQLTIHRDIQVEKVNQEADWLDEWMRTLQGSVTVDLGDRIPIHTTMPMTNDYGESLSKLSEVRVDTDIRGVLDVGFLLGEPTILGSISTLRGSFVTMGKSFELGSGEIVFSGANAYNPQLNLQASKSFGEYGTVNVLVGGTVEEIDMQFEAINTPYTYDSTDIITLILLGKPSQELAQSESQTAATLIQTGLTTTMGGVVGEALGGTMVDNVDWDPTEGMFRVGKTLSDTLYLSYMRNYWAEEGENENEITLEWLLLQKVYGELVTGDANNTHATLYYRWIF
jgi:hypothetical protein